MKDLNFTFLKNCVRISFGQNIRGRTVRERTVYPERGGVFLMEESFGTDELIFILKKIGLYLAAQLDLHLREGDLSGTQVYFMVYLLRRHPQGTYLTELCRETGISKPALSELIKRLRGKGYLFFQENPEDIRKKKVLPTKKLEEEGERFMKKARQAEEEICSGLTPQEKNLLWNTGRKFLTQLSIAGRKTNRQEVLLA